MLSIRKRSTPYLQLSCFLCVYTLTLCTGSPFLLHCCLIACGLTVDKPASLKPPLIFSCWRCGMSLMRRNKGSTWRRQISVLTQAWGFGVQILILHQFQKHLKGELKAISINGNLRTAGVTCTQHFLLIGKNLWVSSLHWTKTQNTFWSKFAKTEKSLYQALFLLWPLWSWAVGFKMVLESQICLVCSGEALVICSFQTWIFHAAEGFSKASLEAQQCIAVPMHMK